MSGATAMNLLEDWCRGMEVDVHRSLLVTGIPEDCGQAELEETLNGVLAPLGTYRVLNKIFLREENVKAALIEVGEGVNLSAVPREFAGRGGIWKVACRDPTQDAEFLKNLNEFLDAEGRTWEDVIRLLQLNHPPPPQSANQASENWGEALGVLLGAVVQVILCRDAEIRSREEARAQEAAEAEEGAAWALAAGKKVKKEPRLATEVGLALKMESPTRWKGMEDQGDPPKLIVRRAGAKARSRRKKQKKTPKQEPVLWKKPKGSHGSSSAYLEGFGVGDVERMEIREFGKSLRKQAEQEEPPLRKPMGTSAWKVPREPSPDTLGGAESPEGTSKSDQGGGQGRPLKKKATGWASGKSLGPVRKKKKVTLGPISYVLVDSEDAKKKLMVPKKGLGSRRALHGPHPAAAPASMSRRPKAKAAGSPRASNDSGKL
uniref:PNMA family member 8A n=1 Tax=Cavia porcellus TaxID=10141 RepID=H0VK73_CAVPO